nr:tyrosine-type recombinase/integrase [Lachnospiraceae bacterium]
DGIISVDDARTMYEQAMKNAVLAAYTWPKRPSSDGYYHINMEDRTKKNGRRQIKAKTIEELEEKVFEYERGLRGWVKKTFAECFEISQGMKLKYVKNPEKKISVNNTISVTRSNYRRFFEGTAFEKMYIDEISRHDIEDFCYKTLSRLKLNRKAFMALRGILRATLKLAYDEGWIFENPVDRVSFDRYDDMLHESTPVEERVHTDEEIDQMLDYIHSYQMRKPHYVPAYALELQILMGLRRGEVAPLEWADIHGNEYVSISKEQVSVKPTAPGEKERFVIVDHTKTHVNRRFPQTSEIRDFLEKYREVCNDYFPGSKFLFPSDDTESGVINNRVVYRFYSRMCDKLGIKISREAMKGPHSFRRNGITRVANNSGGDLLLASRLFGNSPETAMRNYYTGYNMEKALSVLESESVNRSGKQRSVV